MQIKGGTQMGTLSVNKVAGYSLMIGPVIALVMFFLQPGGLIIDPGDADDTAAQAAALVANRGIAIIVSMLIPLGLIAVFSGSMHWVQSMEGGSGHAIARLGLPMIFVAIICWTISLGIASSTAMGFTNEAFVGTFLGINVVSGPLFGIGNLLIALGASTRDEYNTIFAYIAALAGLVAGLVSLLAGFDDGFINIGTGVSGLCFIIISAFYIYVGRSFATAD